MKDILLLFLLLSFMACNNSSKTDEAIVADTAADKQPADSSSNYIHKFTDTALETKITAALLKLPFVIKSNNYIDSLSNHRHGIAFLLDEPAASETDISVQAGYNGEQRFETYYRFLVDPKTFDIKVIDPVTDKKLTVKEYLKTQQ